MRLPVILMLAMVETISAASSRLDVIDLPTGFFPEGIALGEEWTVYVGSLGDGAIWKGDLSTGEGEVVVPGTEGGQALGMKYDRRSGYLFVCGGVSGAMRVYDASDFTVVADIPLAAEGESSFVNDLILSKTAAYITDSTLAQLYKVPLLRENGQLAYGEATEAVTIPLSSEFTHTEGTFNANGIEMTDDGKTLIIVNISSGELFTVDPETGTAALIDVGGVSLHGDGLVLRKNTLWVVENSIFAEPQQISEVALSTDLSCGHVVPRALTNELFDDPATTVRKGNSFYTTMSKFGVAAEDIATTAYEIVRVDRDGGEFVC